MISHFVIGTAGHVDHGKTAFIKALTGMETDRLKDEKLRGITIENGFAHLQLPNGLMVGFIDVPGHEKFIKTMISGATGMDAVILIIAADEGIQPQTIEHFNIIKHLGIHRGFILLTKCDLVDSKQIQEVTLEINTFIKDIEFEKFSILNFSIYDPASIANVTQELEKITGYVDDDGLVIIHESCILAVMNNV